MAPKSEGRGRPNLLPDTASESSGAYDATELNLVLPCGSGGRLSPTSDLWDAESGQIVGRPPPRT